MDGQTDRRPLDSGPLMLSIALGGVALLMRLVSPGLPETGDAVAHYQHSRFAWAHAEAALSQWGKPLFTILASPFAQLGMWGMTLFNSLVAVGTCALIMGTLRGVSIVWRWAVPVLLFTVPVYTHTVIAGLTEPLFGLLSVAVALLAMRERWIPALVLLSFLPFVRPEYAALSPFVCLVALVGGQWKKLPLLLLGPALYALCTGMLLGRPWALFVEHTYLGVSTYGHGDPFLFVHRAQRIFGNGILGAVCLSLIAWILLLWKDPAQRVRLVRHALLTMAPSVGIVALHSYAWWQGGMGSLGLERVMATAVPLAVLFVVDVAGTAWRSLADRPQAGKVLVPLVMAYGVLSARTVLVYRPMPYPDDWVQQTQRDAAAHLEQLRKPDERLLYADPYLAALCDIDPWDRERYAVFNGMGSFRRFRARHGDRVVWDAHFAGYEGRVPLDSLLHAPELLLERVFEPAEPVIGIGDLRYSIHIFRQADAERMIVSDTLFARGKPAEGMRLEGPLPVVHSNGSTMLSMIEFPLTFLDLPVGQPGMHGERLLISGVLTKGAVAYWAFVEHGGDEQLGYEQSEIGPGVFRIEMMLTPRGPEVHNKLYIWNPKLEPLEISDLMVLRKGIWQTLQADRNE